MRRLAAAIMTFALLAFPAATLAHGDGEAGDLEIVIGMIGEPVVVGARSGVEVSIAAADGDPVTGATLEAEVSIAGSSRRFTLEPDAERPGWYTVDFIPTVAGAYTVRLIGEAEGTPVDLEMTAGPETFSEVAAAGDISFPAPLPDPSVTAALAKQADDRASVALILTGLALALGIAATRRRRS